MHWTYSFNGFTPSFVSNVAAQATALFRRHVLFLERCLIRISASRSAGEGSTAKQLKRDNYDQSQHQDSMYLRRMRDSLWS